MRFYAAQIALAIEELHCYGIIHRDIKPENILIANDGYIKLSEFAMAKHLKADERAFSFCGSPEYMAPEIIKKEGYNKAVDWWSFGIVM